MNKKSDKLSELTFIKLVHTQAKMQIDMKKELSLDDTVNLLLDKMDKKTQKTLENNK